MIRIRKNKNIIIGIILILIGVIMSILHYSYYKYIDYKNENLVQKYFKQEDSIIEDNVESVDKPKVINTESYIAILEIPTISLKRGLVDKNSKRNNVNKNIEILKESNMPDVDNSTLILASHSGSGFHSFFKKLYKLNINDYVYLYYQNVKYTYQIVDNFAELKTGKMILPDFGDHTSIVLTTCSQNPKGKQIIYIGYLIDKESY